MAKGDLVPDSVMVGLVAGELKKLDAEPWLLDGFPRWLWHLSFCSSFQMSSSKLFDASGKQYSSPKDFFDDTDVNDLHLLHRVLEKLYETNESPHADSDWHLVQIDIPCK